MMLFEFCHRVQKWIVECLGIDQAYDPRERNFRFLEEACELVQSCEMTREQAHRVVDYVFDREVGETMQELGGVMVTLAALANARMCELDTAASREMRRIERPEIMAKIKAKQAGKPADVRG